jgi:hypothetical protein
MNEDVSDVSQIFTRSEFAEFLRDLVLKCEGMPQSWGNRDTAVFLLTLSRWLDASPGWAENMVTYGRFREAPDVENVSWALMAQALRAALTYD